ncbi:autotransporter outer membrane beta-barrel domain-containing protein [Castellaniella sp. GW247-6E4]|uniref:autotransporter outer membrane beta-barrel domain-containing protein n=1 Tax=Castellaniella sp. GW247-6E4 TaxID=3140380 RepID=UPI0033163C34
MPTDDMPAHTLLHILEAPHWAMWKRRPQRRGPIIAIILALSLAGPVWAANSGGSTNTDCGFSGDSYIGTCSTDSSPATGGDVQIDTPPPSAGDPDTPVLEIIGGMNNADGNAVGNRLTVTGTQTYDGMRFGGGSATCSGNATGNTVSIGGQAILVNGANVIGGDSCSGSAEGNTVLIRDQALVDGGIIMGGTGGGAANGNTVTLRDQATARNGTLIMGGYALNSATGNAVIIRDQATIAGGSLIYGGYTTLGNAADNSVIIRDGAAITDGSFIYGGASDLGEARGNTVDIQGQAIITDANAITGGSSGVNALGNTVIIRDQARIERGTIIGGESNTIGNATGNTIIIRDQAQVVDSVVFGGLATDGVAADNRIVLQGSPILSGTFLMGGDGTNPGGGNTLEIRGTGLRAAGVAGFDHYQYVLPPGTAPGAPVLTLTDTACMCDATVAVDVAQGAGPFRPGTQITLMHADDLATNRYSSSPTTITGRQGLALTYQWGLTATGTDLFATVAEVSVNEESKAPLEGRIAPLALINQGGDLIAGAAMGRAQAAAQTGQWAGFGALSGGSSRYESGSHVDVDGLSFVLGTARRFDTGYGNLAAGAFIELGTGNYNSTNRFDSGTARGSGKSRYYGVGLMARHDFADPAAIDMRGPLGPYAEGSLRAGRAGTDWRSTDLTRTLGADASYDSTAPYYGAHLGLGYVAGLGTRTSADLYAKYFWNHQDGDQVSIAGGDFRFGDADSHRMRVGTRVGYAFSEQTRAYAGAAWEHEFDGSARATVYGFDVAAPSLKGDTGIFELGLEIAPQEARALTVSLGVQAYTGKREGLGGSALLKYAF